MISENSTTKTYYENYKFVGSIKHPFIQKKVVYNLNKILLSLEYHWEEIIHNHEFPNDYFKCQ